MTKVMGLNTQTHAFDLTAVSDKLALSELGTTTKKILIQNPGTEAVFLFTGDDGLTAVFPVDGTPQDGKIILAGESQVFELDGAPNHSHLYGITGSGAVTVYVSSGDAP